MLEPAVFNMSVIVGAVWSSPSFTITINGSAKDLANCFVEVKIFDENNMLVLSLIDNNGLTIIKSSGIITMDAPVTITSTLSKGLYHYQLWITEPNCLDKNLYIFGVLEAYL